MQLLTGFARPGASILDIGCGIGDLIATLSKQGIVVDGTDVSLSALRVARNATRQSNFVLSDARWLPFRDGYYGVVVCSEVLEHIEEHANAAREINRVVAPGGVVLFTVPHGEKHWTWEDQVDGHFRRYIKKDFVDLMNGAGFDIDDIRCWGFPLAALFRNTVSTPLFNRGFHESKSHLKHSPIFRALLGLMVTLFRIDDIFHGSELGIGLVARVKKPLATEITKTQVTVNRSVR